MATNVTQIYTPSLNTSVTVKDGAVTVVTLWTTGDDHRKTNRLVDLRNSH